LPFRSVCNLDGFLGVDYPKALLINEVVVDGRMLDGSGMEGRFLDGLHRVTIVCKFNYNDDITPRLIYRFFFAFDLSPATYYNCYLS
jgi:hypothetical protein